MCLHKSPHDSRVSKINHLESHMLLLVISGTFQSIHKQMYTVKVAVSFLKFLTTIISIENFKQIVPPPIFMFFYPFCYINQNPFVKSWNNKSSQF